MCGLISGGGRGEGVVGTIVVCIANRVGLHNIIEVQASWGISGLPESKNV